jgi:hypothetical protein
MFEQTFKNIDAILHKDAGCSSVLAGIKKLSTETQRPAIGVPHVNATRYF